MDINYLGTPGPAATTSLNNAVADLEDLHVQAVLDLSILADQGVAVTGYKAELDALAEQISLLKADIVTMDDSAQAMTAWRTRADALNAKLRDVLKRTGSARQSAPELAQLRGLGWAVGVLAAATAVGVFVWTHRKKARRRR